MKGFGCVWLRLMKDVGWFLNGLLEGIDCMLMDCGEKSEWVGMLVKDFFLLLVMGGESLRFEFIVLLLRMFLLRILVFFCLKYFCVW